MLGSFGQVMMFVCALAGLAIVTPFFLMHVAHFYVTILTMSSGGEDRLRWPTSSYYEWFGEAVIFNGVVLLWSSLVFFLLTPCLVVLASEWVFWGWALGTWIMLPLGLCSVMSGPSKFLLLWPPLVGRVFRQSRGWIFVSVLTLPLFLGVALGVVWLAKANLLGVLVIVVTLPPALALHARAWGRLMWLAFNYDLPPVRKKKRKRRTAATTEAIPSAEALEEPLDMPLEVLEEEDAADYGVDAPQRPKNDGLIVLTEYYARQRERETKLRERAGDPNPDPIANPVPPTFQTALGEKVISFLFYSDTVGTCFTLSLTCLVEMLFVMILVSL